MYEYALTRSLSVSFQRYPYPATGFVTALAQSWGALPFLVSEPRQLVLPCPNGEAFWIGLVMSPTGRNRVRVVVTTASGERVDALTGAPAGDTALADTDHLPAPLRHGVPGILRGAGGWWAFARHTGETPAPACREIELRCVSGETAAPIRQEAGPDRQHAGPGCPSPSPESQGTSPPPIEADETSFVRVNVVEPEFFEALGGIPVPPLDEANRYGGWRLP